MNGVPGQFVLKRSSIRGELSMPRTLHPASSSILVNGVPFPQPTSRTDAPGVNPAFSDSSTGIPAGPRRSVAYQSAMRSYSCIRDSERPRIRAVTRLTLTPGADTYPVWSHDGRRLLFAAEREGARNVRMPFLRG